MSVEPVYVVPYDSSWPLLFARERDRILGVAGEWVDRIEHVGSTAVSGLAAKPVVDLLVGLRAISDAGACVSPLEGVGYSYWAEGAEPCHHLFVRFVDEEMTARTHNLHLTEIRSPYWRDRLLFRDYLRENAETAQTYARLKRELAHRYRDDREAYTAAKSCFVSEILRLARRNPS